MDVLVILDSEAGESELGRARERFALELGGGRKVVLGLHAHRRVVRRKGVLLDTGAETDPAAFATLRDREGGGARHV